MTLHARMFGAALAVTLAEVSVSGQQPRQVDDAMLMKPADGDWITYGRDQAETHHSPLKQIDQSNVARLAPAWSVEVGSDGKIETTPLVFDGVLYGTSTWSQVYAVDLRSGKLKWKWDPGLVRAGYEADGPRACCGPVNRGVALYKGRVYIGLLDGRLVALNAQTGLPEWAVQTTPAGSDYTITGAPRVARGKVLIGNSGAELGVRGYATAYDVNTGQQLWRFYTVPGDPKNGFENAAMEMAAKTWHGEWWKQGGGGTVWDSIVYDPDLKLVYLGVGNGGPWVQAYRSPGGGDNLYLVSILALNAKTGKKVWHFQTTHHDIWDFDPPTAPILADITADEIKIDRSFITDIHKRPRSQGILKAIESLSEALGMTVIAEGIETFEELAYLQTMTRIRYAQGYYFSKPIFDFLIEPARSMGYKVSVFDIFEFFFVTVKLMYD